LTFYIIGKKTNTLIKRYLNKVFIIFSLLVLIIFNMIDSGLYR